MLNRRATLLGLISATGLGGCSSLSTLISPSLQLQADMLKPATRSRNDYPLPAAALAQIPYSKLGVRIGDQPRLVVLLDRIDGDRLSWISHDRVRFITQQGRLVATHGLQRDLIAMQWDGGDPLQRMASGSLQTLESVAQLSYRREDEAGVVARASLRVRGTEVVEVLGRRHDTVRIDERLDVPAWRWQADNRYWVEPASGIVWRSRQRYCPEIPTVELEWLESA